MTICRFFSFALLMLLLSFITYADSTEETFKTVLDSADLLEQRAAFEKIASSPEQYVPLARNRLVAIANGQIQTSVESLDRLLYLSAFLKDKSLVHPIERLWMDRDFLPGYCLYACPLVFSLTIFATNALWEPPEKIEKVLLRHLDLDPAIRIASEISLEPTPLEQLKQKILGMDRYFEELSKESEQQQISQAGRQTEQYLKRLAAVFQLEYSVSSSENLKDLYWLAIQADKMESANFEFRGALYRAIYRAEKARRRGR